MKDFWKLRLFIIIIGDLYTQIRSARENMKKIRRPAISGYFIPGAS